MTTLSARNKTPIIFPKRGSLSTPAEISLFPGTLYTFRRRKHAVSITLHSGKLFITQESDPRDHILKPGEQITLTNRGRVIVEAFSPSVFTRTPADRN